jgi:hypothetical protein
MFFPYFDFIEKFGTHFISDIKFGSKYGAFQTLSFESYRKLTNDDVEVLLAASRSVPGLTFNDKDSTPKAKSEILKFKN